MREGQNRPEHTESSRESSFPLKRTQQAGAEGFIICGVVTATFRVLSLLVLTTCHSYSKLENVKTDCNDNLLGISNNLNPLVQSHKHVTI
jgi:hypothetical protein